MAVGDQFRLHGGEDAARPGRSGGATGETPLTGPAAGGPTRGPAGPGTRRAARRPRRRSTSCSRASGPGPRRGRGAAPMRRTAPVAERPRSADAERRPRPSGRRGGARSRRRADRPARRAARTGGGTARPDVKRALGDDQNRLLDRLRSAPSRTIDELLGPEDEHVDVYAAAARGHLVEAFTAGTVFAGAKAAAVPEGDAVDQAAARAGARRGDHAAPPDGRGRAATVGDRVGAAFREWRGERVERLAGDYATQAFSAGVVAARHRRTSCAGWSRPPTAARTATDNALAGAVRASESFPTGHAHPPAHSGCRCLVAPAERLTRTPPSVRAAGRPQSGPGWWTLGSPRAHPQRLDLRSLAAPPPP